MRLKKATNIKTDYPSRESIKPILAGLGMALTLSACTQTVGQEPIIKDERRNIEESANEAGGMPVYIPPPKEQNTSNIHKFKKEKEEIVPPRVTAGVPVPKSK
jgi:hypothetical protein